MNWRRTKARLDDDENWITLKNGVHVLTNGENEVVSGAEGSLNGTKLPSAKSCKFSLEDFSDATKYESEQDFDDWHRWQTAEVWNSLSDNEKNALADYTSHTYLDINNRLRSGEDLGEYADDAKTLHDAIEQSKIQENMLLYRGTDRDAFESLFGMDKGSLSPDSVDELVGKVGTDEGFMSTSATDKSVYYGGSDVQMEILTPEWTQALYAEPFSANGNGRLWDGESTRDSFSSEDEVILQSGTELAIVSAEYDSSRKQYKIKAAITNTKSGLDLDSMDDNEITSVGVNVIQDGKLLTGRRQEKETFGQICSPGGHIEEGETPEEAAIRETQEEFGITPKDIILIGYGRSGNALFLCTEYEGDIHNTDGEMADLAFRSLEELEDEELFEPFKYATDLLLNEIEDDGHADLALLFKDLSNESMEFICNELEIEPEVIYTANDNSLQMLYDLIMDIVSEDEANEDGGPGSGNHGHKGVEGQVGGSAPSNGSETSLGKKVPEEYLPHTENRTAISDNTYYNKRKKDYLNDCGYQQEDVEKLTELVHRHCQDNTLQNQDEMTVFASEHLNLIKESANYELQAISAKALGDDVVVYRKGLRDNTILSWTDNDEGVTLYEGTDHEVPLGWDDRSTVKELVEQGYYPVSGIGSNENHYESEITFINTNDIEERAKEAKSRIAQREAKANQEKADREEYNKKLRNAILDYSVEDDKKEAFKKVKDIARAGDVEKAYLYGCQNGLTKEMFGVLRKMNGDNADGGSGSGNWGHEGRPGKVGGSSEGGGVHNRQTDKSGNYTSFSKKQKAAAKPHKTNWDEIKDYPIGTTIMFGNGSKAVLNNRWGDADDKYLKFSDGTKVYADDADHFNKAFSNVDAMAAIPNTTNPNYKKQDGANDYRGSFNEAFRATTEEEYDDVYREQTGTIWQSLSDEERSTLSDYTGSGYEEINKTLRGAKDNVSNNYEKIETMTSAIEQSPMKNDTVLYRGCSKSSIEKLLNLTKGSLDKMSVGSLVGKSGTDDGFLSCGSAEDTGYTNNVVQMEILCPKGTKAIYAEPFSKCGYGSGEKWDGASGQTLYSSEFETIIQRGTALTVVEAKGNGYNIYLKVAVTSQDYEKSEISKKLKAKN